MHWQVLAQVEDDLFPSRLVDARICILLRKSDLQTMYNIFGYIVSWSNPI